MQELVSKFPYKFDWIGVELIHQIQSKEGKVEEFDTFAGGAFTLDNENNIIPLDGDSYSKNMDIWFWEEFTNPKEGLTHELSIWVRDF